jgi:3-oxoisoapionate kinase
MQKNDLLLTYYGDDFTGSTDVMEGLILGGVPAVLYLDPPTPAQLRAQFPDVRAVGVAGVSRTLSPAAMESELPGAFEALKGLGAPVFHYKVCSTFDSSPTVGSIGCATEIGMRVFGARVVPMMVGAPSLKRYVVFGNLFARAGEVTYRIDRHPTMSRHPITPMHESDLCLHLAQQTSSSIRLMDLLHLAQPDAEDRYFQMIEEGAQVILFDTIDQAHLKTIGRLLWKQQERGPVFVVGSSGVEYALTGRWQEIGIAAAPPPLAPPGPVEQLIVMSGSAAPGTAAQIDWALAHGFAGLRLNPSRLIDDQGSEQAFQAVLDEALRLLGNGSSVLLFSAQGPDDPTLQETRTYAAQLGLSPAQAGTHLATIQGQILHRLLERSGLRRACVTGGDTSGNVARQLGIYALQMIIPIAPGAPLCRAYSHNPRFNGLEISLKGGQNGGADYFGSIQQGHA